MSNGFIEDHIEFIIVTPFEELVWAVCSNVDWLTDWPTDWLIDWSTDWLTDWLTGFIDVNPSWDVTSCADIQEFPQNFMESEGWLPRWIEPATVPYLEPDESSPYHPIQFIQEPFNIILPPIFRLPLAPSSFPTRILYAFYISLSMIWPFCLYEYVAKSASYETPHNAVFSSLLPLIFPWSR
jgi:hypothetical protein